MPEITAKPFMMKARIKVGDDDYTAHATLAEFNPTQPTASITTVDGKTKSFGGLSSWVFDIAGLQDWETLNSLSAFFNAHEGEEANVSVDLPGGTHVGTVILAAVKIGGKPNEPAIFNKSMTVTGTPVFTPTPGP